MKNVISAMVSFIIFSIARADILASQEPPQDRMNRWLAPIAGEYHFKGNDSMCESLVIENNKFDFSIRGDLRSFSGAGWTLTTIWKPNEVTVTPNRLIYETSDRWGEVFADPNDLDNSCKTFDIKERLELRKNAAGELISFKVDRFYKEYLFTNCLNYQMRQIMPARWKAMRTVECRR